MRSATFPRRMAALALLATAACSDGGTAPPVPASLVAMTATTQTAVVGALVPVPPSVRVSDDRGRAMEGLQVAFRVTAGEGTVTSTATTDAGGVATVADWTMGSVAQENALTATVEGVAPVVFRAAAAADVPVLLQKAGGDEQAAVVATALADSIGVRVVDRFGNGVRGVTVNFTASGGTLSAGRVTTGDAGTAKVGLLLPIRPGIVEVMAGSGGLEPLSFRATATVGPAATITRVAGEGQMARSGSAVPVAPSVRVTDAHGNPVSGVSVTFAPLAGSGVVTGGVATTTASGQAQVGSWRLGEPGANRLSVTAGAAPAVEFSATSHPRCDNHTYQLFATTAGVLYPSSGCAVQGRNAEIYTFTVATTQCIAFGMASDFDAFLYLLDASGNVLAADDDSGDGLNSLIRARLTPGTYRLGAAAYAGGTGSFQLSSAAATSCSAAMAAQPVTPGKTR